MANLGNAWHIPTNPEPAGRAGMRIPIGATIPIATITVFNGNQFQGDGNAGNQLQVGSGVFFKRSSDAVWNNLPMTFDSANGNDKFFAATIPIDTLLPGDVVEYYFQLAYDDHDATFLIPNGAFSATVADEPTAQASPFTVTMAPANVAGQWSETIPLTNVPIHAHVLPTGQVLYWGRRETPGQQDFDSLNEHETHAFILDPATRRDRPTLNQPRKPLPGGAGDEPVNLFCSGHTFLPDGRLMVVGGHLFDSVGVDQATIFDPASETWTPSNKKANPATSAGRWYPSVVTLADGSVMVCSGSHLLNPLPDPPPKTRPPGGSTPINDLTEVWDGAQWTVKTDFNTDTGQDMPLFPRFHVAPDGRIFMAGGLAESYFFSPTADKWADAGFKRALRAREYAPSVMYDTGKIVFIGGGLDQNQTDDGQPSNQIEFIDLNVAAPSWTLGPAAMNFSRRQHNASILPDGTVLVTGGTQGNGFNNLAPGQPVHSAEIWDPVKDEWTLVGSELFDRCYHSTSLLLPDATVLSAGGGEYAPNGNDFNPAKDSLPNAQIYQPPYLFKKPTRPKITAAPPKVGYGETFTIVVDVAAEIGKVSWVRLPSVTHSFDQNQRLNFLTFAVTPAGLAVTAPANANLCPPGHYMLFVLDNDGVPSEAVIVQILAAPAFLAVSTAAKASLTALRIDSKVQKAKDMATASPRPAVKVGLTPICPYGISACWGGAHEALSHMTGVLAIRPFANAQTSLAVVFTDGNLPDPAVWSTEFKDYANGNYGFRGVEVNLEGIAHFEGDKLLLDSSENGPVTLLKLDPVDKIQWSHLARAIQPLTPREANSFEKLVDRVSAKGPLYVRVVGPIRKVGLEFQLLVRLTKPLVRAVSHVKFSEIETGSNVPAALANQPKGLAPGFRSNPSNDLSFDGGHTIQDLTYRNFFVGEWADSDLDNIDRSLAAVMQDPGLNDILQQYYGDKAVTTTVLPSGKIPVFGGPTVNKDDVESQVKRLHDAGSLGLVDFSKTVFNFILPKGIFLTSNSAADASEAHPEGAEAHVALVRPEEDDEDSSTAGLGGYHGSVDVPVADGSTRVYYAVGVFSEQIGTVTNGIPVFSESWKNVVATFYHELTEARTDPDVEVGNATGDASKFGWVASDGEIGDIPIDLAANINMVIKEVKLASGQLAPVQLMYSNRVHGPEEP